MPPVSELDLGAAELIADPYPHFQRARAAGPVQWHDGLRMWLAISHREADAVLRARSLGRLWAPRFPDRPMPSFELIHRNSLLENEPPVHTRLRRLVAAAFARGQVERLRPRIAALTEQLADDLAAELDDAGAADLIGRFAEPLPVRVIGELLGIPRSDWPLLRPWSNAIVTMYEYRITEDQRVAAETAAAEFVAYLRELVGLRRRSPGDDLISALIVETDSDGARLSEDELITTATLLLNAGHEATVNVIGNGVRALLDEPDQWRRLLAEPALLAGCVEELIRFDSPLQLFERTALADTRIGDVTVERGAKIAALLGAANRDPAVFDDPNSLDVGRLVNPHLGFGAGIHFCLGAPLARIELQAALATLLRRFPSLRLAGEPVRSPAFVIRGWRRLPVAVGG